MTRRPARMLAIAMFAILALVLAACGDDGGTPGGGTDATTDGNGGGADTGDDTGTDPGDDAGTTGDDAGPGAGDTGDDADDDTGEPVEDGPTFAFGVSPGQPFSAGPFPSDLLLGDDGKVEVGSLGDDPRTTALAKPEVLAQLDGIIAQRTGFGYASAVHFFMHGKPAIDTFEGRVHVLALTGPEAGREVASQVFWSAPAGTLGVHPAWGDYLLADTTYAVLIRTGVELDSGEVIEATPAFTEVIGTDPPTESTVDVQRARVVFAPVRDWIEDEADLNAADFVIGTVFTTEGVLDLGTALIAAADAFPLEAPTLRVGWDIEAGDWIEAPVYEGADALASYFGTPAAPYENNPGYWSDGLREEAATLAGLDAPYAGGSMHHKVGAVINGSFVAPAFNYQGEGADAKNLEFAWEDDAIVYSTTALVPFTLWLCEDHLADPADLPVAVFTHGGTGIRSNAGAWANLNCTMNIATISYDIPFHGGRIAVTVPDGMNVRVPVRQDDENTFSGLTAEDDDYVPDHIGDNGGGPETVGQLFAMPLSLDPGVVEANLLTITSDTHVLVRLLGDGDWSGVREGLSFDGDNLFHESLSYGTSFTTALMALTDSFRGVIQSVGSGWMEGLNLTTAPANSELASGILRVLLGLQSTAVELQAGAYRDLVVTIESWLSQRGDPIGWAPYVLRYRQSDYELPVLGSGDSWDETLNGMAQVGFGAAYGLPVYTDGPEWTIDPSMPGADTVTSTPWPGGTLNGNATFGDRSHSAAFFYSSKSCHTLSIVPVCTEKYEKPYPPVTKVEVFTVSESPVCALQTQAQVFLQSLLDGDTHGDIVAPSGTCDALYSE